MDGHSDPQTGIAIETVAQEREDFFHVIDFYPAPREGEAIRAGEVSVASFSTVDFRSKSDLSHVEEWERPKGACRWIHIPVNDADIARECARRLVSEASSQRLHNTWLQKIRPAIPISPQRIPHHAWSMEPSVQLNLLSGQVEDEQKSPKNIQDLTLFLPYLNWQHYRKIKNKSHNRPGKPHVRHQRRTMDEFYHSGLQDMRDRNAGQTASKWTGTGADVQTLSKWETTRKAMPEHGWTKAEDDSLVIMVDQAWIWALDECTLVSCFPTSEPLRDQSASYPVDLDVMASAIALEDLKKCQDIVDLLALLVHRSIDRIFEESKTGFVDMLSIYRWAAANKATRHTELLMEFWERQSDSATGGRATEGKEELNLILEVVDILDELNMLMLLHEKQAAVLNDLRQKCSLVKPQHEWQKDETSANTVINLQSNYGEVVINSNSFQTHVGQTSEVGGYAGTLMQQAADRVQAERADTKRLHGEVTQTRTLLLELLDLESKQASLKEARVSTTQGRAVMLFTIVTIIFLPLSFFTSYFGQNVVEFTGDDKNPQAGEVWKVGAPISVVVIVVAITIAVVIMSPWKQISSWWRRHREQRGKLQADIPLV